MLSNKSVIQLLRVSVFTQKKISASRSFRKRNLLFFNGVFKFFFPEMMSQPDYIRPRALLGLITQPTLKGVALAGNLNDVLIGKTGQNDKKFLGIQKCKNPTGHIDS